MGKHIVELTQAEKETLTHVVSNGKAAAYKIKHANILLLANQAEGGSAWTDEKIAEAVHCRARTVANVRKRLVTLGLDAALGRQNQGVGRPPKFNGESEARLTMIACSAPPDGRSRWTIRLLADKMVELGCFETCGKTQVQQVLKKVN